jgi:hypothetical protein
MVKELKEALAWKTTGSLSGRTANGDFFRPGLPAEKIADANAMSDRPPDIK